MSLAQSHRAVMALAVIPLPDGWTAESYGQRWLTIYHPNACAVTIDAEQRVIRPGGTVTHGATIGQIHVGRGWIAKIHADAVAWLLDLENERGAQRCGR